jgi:hypothetical protein
MEQGAKVRTSRHMQRTRGAKREKRPKREGRKGTEDDRRFVPSPSSNQPTQPANEQEKRESKQGIEPSLRIQAHPHARPSLPSRHQRAPSSNARLLGGQLLLALGFRAHANLLADALGLGRVGVGRSREGGRGLDEGEVAGDFGLG